MRVWALGVFASATADMLIRKGVFSGDGGGQADAFRHAFASALIAKSFGIDVAKLYTDAHEANGKGAGNIDNQMDYYNNAQGMNIGTSTSWGAIKTAITNHLTAGGLIYINNGALTPTYGSENLR